MNVYEEPAESGGGAKATKADPVKEFKAMPVAERLLAGVAVAIIAVYLISSITGKWQIGVFDACSLLGSLAVLGLVVPHILGARFLPPRIRMYAFAVAGVFPAFGYVIHLFTSDIWHALMLAGGITMGLTAWQIAERERLIK
jgi:hypothetical protein